MALVLEVLGGPEAPGGGAQERAQVVAALPGRLRQQGQVRRDEGPLVVTHVTRVPPPPRAGRGALRVGDGRKISHPGMLPPQFPQVHDTL